MLIRRPTGKDARPACRVAGPAGSQRVRPSAASAHGRIRGSTHVNRECLIGERVPVLQRVHSAAARIGAPLARGSGGRGDLGRVPRTPGPGGVSGQSVGRADAMARAGRGATADPAGACRLIRSGARPRRDRCNSRGASAASAGRLAWIAGRRTSGGHRARLPGGSDRRPGPPGVPHSGLLHLSGPRAGAQARRTVRSEN